MTIIRHNLRFVTADVDRYGTVRYYFRRPGQPKVRLRGEPRSAEFNRAYQLALAGGAKTDAAQDDAKEPRQPLPGSLRAMVNAYLSSGPFRRLDVSTQAWQTRALDRVCAEPSGKDGKPAGVKPIALMRPSTIRKLRDTLSATPGAANTRLKALKSAFRWAVENDEAPHNPAREVEKIRYVSRALHTWTTEEVEQFERRHPIGTKARLAMALMLYTTGRREDAVRLGRQHISKGRIRFVQAKNEHRNPVTVDIPLVPDLETIIAATPGSGNLTFLTTEYGQPFTPAGFGNRFREWCDEAGLPHCSAHGLRKAGATRIAERGGTAHEIMSVTGHQTLEEVERYTRAARRVGLANSAMSKAWAVPLLPDETK